MLMNEFRCHTVAYGQKLVKTSEAGYHTTYFVYIFKGIYLSQRMSASLFKNITLSLEESILSAKLLFNGLIPVDDCLTHATED